MLDNSQDNKRDFNNLIANIKSLNFETIELDSILKFINFYKSFNR